jgi:hypothetical protein
VGLDDEHIGATNGVVVATVDLAIGELPDVRLARRDTEVTSNRFSQGWMCSTGNDLEVAS